MWNTGLSVNMEALEEAPVIGAFSRPLNLA